MDNVIRCSCKNAYQDKTYGAGQRVGTPGNKGLRCTVCGTQHSDGSSPKRK